jgi:predicted anti-sigma-YlaC factor YlaD
MQVSSIQRSMEVLTRPWIASCEETRERLSAHLEGELEGREEKRVLRHLVRCERCREVLRTLARAIHGLQALSRVDVSVPVPSAAEAVVERVRRDLR